VCVGERERHLQMGGKFGAPPLDTHRRTTRASSSSPALCACTHPGALAACVCGAKVDIDKNKEVAGGLGIQQVPAFKIIDAKAMDGDWPKEYVLP